MRYQVTFRKRFNAEGGETDDPTQFVHVADGVILEAGVMEQQEPQAMHTLESMEEDDSFLSLGAELWEFEVAEGREREFLDALRNSEMVLDVAEVEDVV